MSSLRHSGDWWEKISMMVSRRRDIAPDVLRGFALLGILFVNIPFMALSSGDGARGHAVLGLANSAAAFFMAALFQGKFYLLFSFLFGYSTWYIVRGDTSRRGRWMKRCIALMLIGALHGTLFWHAEIVFVYGIFGLLLYPFLFRADTTLKRWSIVVFVTISVLLVGLAVLLLGVEAYLPSETSNELPLSAAAALDGALRNGTLLEIVVARSALWVETLGFLVFIQGGLAFSAFLLGLRAARREFLSDSTDHQRSAAMVRYGIGIGLPIQLGLAAVWLGNELNPVVSEGWYVLTVALSFVTAPLLTMGYIGLILKIIAERPNLVAWMKSAGQISLTLYVAQSLITTVMFASWGFGLFQQLQLWQLMAIAVAIWVGQISLAMLWLRRFSSGPLEWVVRTLTKDR